MVITFVVWKIGAIALAQLGLTAGRLTGRQTKCWRFLKLYIGQNIGILVVFKKVQCHYGGTSTF